MSRWVAGAVALIGCALLAAPAATGRATAAPHLSSAVLDAADLPAGMVLRATASSTNAELLHDEPALRELTRRYRLNGLARNFRLPEKRVPFATGVFYATTFVSVYRDPANAHRVFDARRVAYAGRDATTLYLPTFGEESFALRGSSTADGFAFTEIMVQWRVGRVHAGLVLLARPGYLPTSVAVRLARIQLDRVAAFSKAIPPVAGSGP
jgi:hypothetical protein